MPKNKYYFISDAHLGSRMEENEIREKRLVEFCLTIADDANTLFLLGDIFDFWFEYKHAIPSEHFMALSALCNLKKKGTRIVHICGNHDFWMGRFLTDTIGMEVHFTPITEKILGKTIFLCHGDELAEEEWFYPAFKKLLRNKLNRRLYRLIHPDIGVPFAKFISAISRRHIESMVNRDSIVSKYRASARESLKESGADAIVLGHTHFADLVEWDDKTYVNTGNWMNDFNYALFENNRFTLHQFK